MPKVSVIVPTHNRADLLKAAIQSVLDQTYADFELLVCDDASNDHTTDTVAGFSDPRIIYTRYEKNSGVVELRNNAVDSSRGAYIAFLDDDDEWLPEKLEKQVNVLDRSSRETGAVFTGAIFLDTRLGRERVVIPRHRGNIFKELLFNDFIVTSSLVVKKSCFEKAGRFDHEFKSASDFDMWIRISALFEFDCIEEPLVRYRVHQNSISNNNLNVIRGLERLIAKHSNSFNGNKRAYGNHLFKLGIAYCYSGNMSEGRKALIKAIQLNPHDVRYYYNLAISSMGAETFKKIKEIRARYFPLKKTAAA